MRLEILNETKDYISPAKRDIPVFRNTDSFFNEAMRDITAIEKNKLSIMMEYYNQIYDANEDIALVMEATDGLLDHIREIIDKFIALIKRLFNKFITAMNSIVKSDKYLKKYKDRFKEFSSDCEFDMDIYTYTKIDDDAFPRLNAYESYKNDNLDEAKKELKSGVDYTHALYTKFTDGLADFYDVFRGKVLADDDSNTTPYSSDEYSKELFRIFRNGDDSKTNTTITSTEVDIAYRRFDKYDTTLKHVEKMKSNLVKEYERIKKDIKNLNAEFTKGNTKYTNTLGDDIWVDDKTVQDDYADEKKKKRMNENITTFINAKADQVNQMSIIHSAAFTAKLDAIKEAYTQDKKLLYAALKKINKIHDYTVKESYIEEESLPEYIDIGVPHVLTVNTEGSVIS